MLRSRTTPASRKSPAPELSPALPGGGRACEHWSGIPTLAARPTAFGQREPTKQEIRERAYYIYLARGGVNGDPVSDWLQAERELREELRGTGATWGPCL